MSAAEFFETSLLVAAAALIIERTFGYPEQVVRIIGHPVIWIGSLIGWCDRQLNRPAWSEGRRKFTGTVTLFVAVGLGSGIALVLMLLLRSLPFGWVAEAVCFG